MSSQPTRSNPSRALPALAHAPGGPLELERPKPTLVPSEPALPPVARAAARVDTVHGEVRIDEYFWLRNREDPEVLAYLEAENRYTEAMMRHTEPLQERLFREMRGRIKETDLSVPERLDGWLYYSRTMEGAQYPMLCRRPAAEGDATDDGAEEVLLDQNPLAEGHAYFRLGTHEVSPDHTLLAYAVDTSGAEAFTLYVKDLATGELLAETIGNVSPSVAWANDSRTLFYVVLDEARRPCRLYRHRLGENPVEDVLVHFEPDEAFFLDISRSGSREYLLLDLGSHSTSEVRYASADRPEESFRVVEPRRAGIEYTVTHHGSRFLITTNDDAPNFRLVSAPVENPGKAAWTEVLPHRPAVKLDSTDAFRDHLVVYEREAGLRQIRVLPLAGGAYLIPFPEPVYTIRQHENPEFDTSLLRFSYTSMVTPNAVVDWDMAARTWTVRKQTEVLGGYDPSQYRTERLFATAPDGERVPVSLVYRLPLAPGERRPLLLNGYGAYGVSFDPAFSSSSLSLLDRGFIVAIAHVRGGEEMGRAWYEGGKLLKKPNSFTDFIAAAEHLIAAGFTSADRLVVTGGSAGGLLMGAVANLRPDLFRAVLAEVPFVDVVNTMLDATLPLTVIEYDEWGNPNHPAAYACIRSYSPYDNVESKDYPHMLVTAGLNDPRVAYWEPAKWTARLRARKTDGNRLLLKTNMGAGHGGASGRWDYLREVAFKYAFVLDVVGMGAG
ncbi:MAG TPA: S9 family peptidase [Gemmatimonadales bacterium]|jgi:oligopeptidase B|nr:S9 family peptidase [Gemmatimonadales bacterium]